MIIDCHTHFWRYPAELTEELARETFIMRRQEVDLDITPEMHASAVAKVDRAIVFGLRAPSLDSLPSTTPLLNIFAQILKN